MIEGIKVRLTSEQFQSLTQERAKFHAQKAAWYEAKAAEVKEAVVAEDAPGGYATFQQRQHPAEAFKGSAKFHRDRSGYFAALSEFTVPNETYLLTEQEIATLELAQRER